MEPISSLPPCGGVCSSTVPGSASGSSRVVLSTVKPMSSRVVVALSSCVPVTSGTGKVPVASQICTSSPCWAVLPAAGVERVTIPRSVFLRSSLSTCTGTRPASVISCSASSRDFPTMSGTSTASGPAETVTVTVEPSVTSWFAGGSVSITRPCSTSEDSTCSKVGVSPTSSREARASSSVCPTTSGTGTIAGPRSFHGWRTASAAAIRPRATRVTRTISHHGRLRFSSGSTSSPERRARGPVAGEGAEPVRQSWGRIAAAPAAPAPRAPAVAGSASVASSSGLSTVVASGSSCPGSAPATSAGARPATTAAMSREKATALG